MVKTVCVIGCGVAGLLSIKACLEEGHDVICFEQSDAAGGTWNYTDRVAENQGAVVFYRLATNTSKELMRFSDFPMPDHYPPFPTRVLVKDYLIDYAKTFDLLRHVQFNTQVVQVKKTEDYDVTGQWVVGTRDLVSGNQTNATFDAVMVASGYFRKPFRPTLAGQSKFPGTITHAIDFRKGETYKDKRVVVVGNSFSAGDIAVDIATFANQVFLSVGDGTWVNPRFFGNNKPLDFIFTRMLYRKGTNGVDSAYRELAQLYMDHDRTGLSPPNHRHSENRDFTRMINDQICHQIGTGRVRVRGFLERLDGFSAIFTEGVRERVDDVVLATGFTADYPFLHESICPVHFQDRSLYKLVWPCDLRHPTLAIIGAISTVGSFWPPFEMQARWVAMVFSGRRHLPTKREMILESLAFKNYQSRPDKETVYAVPYQEDIAELIGCRPNIWRYVLKDPKLAWKLQTGPLFTCQYRLEGPHSKPDAREQFFRSYTRTVNATQNRGLGEIVPLPKQTILSKLRVLFVGLSLRRYVR